MALARLLHQVEPVAAGHRGGGAEDDERPDHGPEDVLVHSSASASSSTSGLSSASSVTGHVGGNGSGGWPSMLSGTPRRAPRERFARSSFARMGGGGGGGVSSPGTPPPPPPPRGPPPPTPPPAPPPNAP